MSTTAPKPAETNTDAPDAPPVTEPAAEPQTSEQEDATPDQNAGGPA
jgi:hypothetical protein